MSSKSNPQSKAPSSLESIIDVLLANYWNAPQEKFEEAQQAIETAILEIIGEDETWDDYGGVAFNRDSVEPSIRNAYKSELRTKLTVFCRGK